MSYGIETYDSNGNLILDNERLMHRFWDKFEVSSEGNYYYDEPLDHEPTVVDVTLSLYSFAWSHIISGGNYTGINVYKIDDSYEYSTEGITLFLIFARR